MSCKIENYKKSLVGKKDRRHNYRNKTRNGERPLEWGVRVNKEKKVKKEEI